MPERMDDPLGIPNETRLFRRIAPSQIVWDDNRKEWRPVSQNFNDSQDRTPMSVFAENIALANGEQPLDFLRGLWETFYLASVTAGWMRECDQEVYPDPDNQLLDDYFHSHSAVRGPKGTKVRKKLAERYGWVIPPPHRYEPPSR